MADDLVYSVGAALNAMSLTVEFKKYVVDNRVLWSTFGKMDSHLYRKKLMKLMEAAKLTQEQKLVVHFLFSVVKKKSRVIDGLAGLSADTQKMSWFEPVKSFISGTIVDYNVSAKTPDKFPGTHVPTTNPGLDMMLWRLSTDPKDRTLDAFFIRTTSVQLHLAPESQAKAKLGYKSYWDDVVKGTKNSVKTEDSKYREDYYNTSAGDTYLLVDDNLKEVKPKNSKVGYTLEEITNWMLEDVSEIKSKSSSS